MYYNWVQVFGDNKLLWFVPLNLKSGKNLPRKIKIKFLGAPMGDGVVFAHKNKVLGNTGVYTQLAER